MGNFVKSIGVASLLGVLNSCNCNLDGLNVQILAKSIQPADAFVQERYPLLNRFNVTSPHEINYFLYTKPQNHFLVVQHRDPELLPRTLMYVDENEFKAHDVGDFTSYRMTYIPDFSSIRIDKSKAIELKNKGIRFVKN